MAVLGAGDAITLRFAVPDEPVPAGWKRDFILHSIGWDKDADLNTIYGQTVEPLPFRGMRSYPFGPDEAVPESAEYREYLRRYPDAGTGPPALLATIETARHTVTNMTPRFRRTRPRTPCVVLRIPSGGLRCADRSPGVVGKERSAGWVPGQGAPPTCSFSAKTWTYVNKLGGIVLREFSGATRISVRGASPSGRVGVHQRPPCSVPCQGSVRQRQPAAAHGRCQDCTTERPRYVGSSK